jgi:hypothetical protein
MIGFQASSIARTDDSDRSAFQELARGPPTKKMSVRRPRSPDPDLTLFLLHLGIRAAELSLAPVLGGSERGLLGSRGFVPLHLAEGERNQKLRAPAYFAFDFDAPVMVFDDAARQR